MGETVEFSITRASQLTIPNKDWTHYRLGLKIRCSNGCLGVTIGIVSQGKSIDTTMITASNVKFLAKEPIIGLKIFDGEKLRKRLQVTFTSEGNFNMFANKINQWLGLTVASSYDASDLQNANSQQTSGAFFQGQLSFSQAGSIQTEHKSEQASQAGGSQQIASQSFGPRVCASQCAIPDAPSSQLAYSQDTLSQVAPSQRVTQQHEFTQLSPYRSCSDPNQSQPLHERPKPEDTSYSHDAVLLLLSAAANDNNLTVFPQYDTSMLSQSTQIWNDSRANVLQYPTTSANNTCFTQMTADPESTNSNVLEKRQKSTSDNLMQSLKQIPFNPSIKKKDSRSSRSKSKRGMAELLEATIARILEERKEEYVDLSDEELSLKLCRRLKSRTFLLLLKRVENLLD